jgi:hypothetical protein
MNDSQARRMLAITGLLIGLGVLGSVSLYFVYSGPPPASNVLTRGLITLIVCALMIVFFSTFSHLIRRADPEGAWLASIVQSAGTLFVGIVLVSTAFEAGVVFGHPQGTLDPTIDGSLADANVLMHGSIKRLLTTIVMFSAGYAVLRTRIFSSWVVWSAYFVGLCNLAYIPSLFFGTDVTEFYSAIGWGNTALVGSFIAYWMFAVGIAAMKRPSTSRPTLDAPSFAK